MKECNLFNYIRKHKLNTNLGACFLKTHSHWLLFMAFILSIGDILLVHKWSHILCFWPQNLPLLVSCIYKNLNLHWSFFFILSIFRCTLTKIPDSSSLLQKSRLPFGILIHPFRDAKVRSYYYYYFFLVKASKLYSLFYIFH